MGSTSKEIEERGAVFTKQEVVQFMLDQVGYVGEKNLSKLKVLEPAAGHGAFAVEIIKRLYESSLNFDFDFKEALHNIHLFEIEEDSLNIIKNNINNINDNISISRLVKLHCTDFLLAQLPLKFDLIIGNPPYIRWDSIPSNKRKLYASLYTTFRGRSDIYIPFYEKSLAALNSDGILSFICSNRWFKAAYGKNLRQLITGKYNLERIIDLEEANPFLEKVAAYPAITVIRNDNKTSLENQYTYSKIKHLSQLKPLITEQKRYFKFNSSNTWNEDVFLEYIDSRYYSKITSQGFNIKIGIATGNDGIFINSNFDNIIEQELLVPIIKSKHLKNNTLTPSDLKIINVFNKDGGMITLSDYPKLNSYLLKNKEDLKNRHIAKKNPDNWFRTIDKLRIEDLTKAKVLLPDISGNSMVFIDRGKYYPHHNIYYITHNKESHVFLMAAILMSDFVRIQLAAVGNKMNGGYPRWQSQNLRRLLIPNISKMSHEWRQSMLNAYHQPNLDQINQLMQQQVIENEFEDAGQMVLFEPNDLPIND